MAQSEAEEGERESERLTEGHNGKILSLSNLLPVQITQMYQRILQNYNLKREYVRDDRELNLIFPFGL